MVLFRFGRIGAAGERNCDCEKKTENGYVKGISAALAFHRLLRCFTTRHEPGSSNNLVSDLLRLPAGNAVIPLKPETTLKKGQFIVISETIVAFFHLPGTLGYIFRQNLRRT
jgi:hypothetical protein